MIIMSMMVLACVVPTVGLPASDAISTSAAQTVIAGFVQTALSETLQPAGQAPTLTFTPEPLFSPTPTVSPTQTPTATLFFTPTALTPQISVSVATNCRVGPGKVYRMVGALLVGEVAQVYGRDPTGQYWYIRNPDSASGYCWLWGEYATVVGNTALIPVYTPPPRPTATFTPTPTPNFNVEYTRLDSCSGWWVEFRLENTGTLPFRSVAITVRDTVTKDVVTSFADGFTNRNGCKTTNSVDVLGADQTRVVSAPKFNHNPRGHRLRATIILCSKTGQNGTCVTKRLVFTP
jgi:hypothetical protein